MSLALVEGESDAQRRLAAKPPRLHGDEREVQLAGPAAQRPRLHGDDKEVQLAGHGHCGCGSSGHGRGCLLGMKLVYTIHSRLRPHRCVVRQGVLAIEELEVAAYWG